MYSFSFVFTTNIEIMDFGSFLMDMTYLGMGLSKLSAARCLMYYNNIVSHKFHRITFTSLEDIKMILKENSLL